MTPIFTVLFQASLDQGIIPADWKSANVVPVFKKGDRAKPENYRPVSLTSIVCKTLEHIVCSSIHRHLDQHNILCDAQHGFRKKRSCTSQLLLTIQDLAKGMDMGDQTDVILLDLSKAFDKVPHGRLMYKVNYYGIRGNTHTWIQSLLSNRSQKVQLEGSSSHTSPVLSGVPQGSVVGPLLFLLLINDLPEYVSSKTSVRLFADDCVMYRKVATEEDTKALQKDLDALQNWESDWLMQFHPQKCQVMHISTTSRKKEAIQNSKYHIHGIPLVEAEKAKYLGLNLHKNLKWNHHLDAITKKANSTSSFLQRNIRSCPLSTRVLCYKAFVLPVLEYAAVIWDPYTQKNIRKVEMVQRRFARFAMKDFRRTSSVTDMLTQLQWTSLEERRAQQKVCMVYSIVHNLIDIPPNTYFIQTTGPSTRGNPDKFQIPYARNQVYQKSFFPDATRLWNALPSEIVGSTSLDIFKKEVAQVRLR